MEKIRKLLSDAIQERATLQKSDFEWLELYYEQKKYLDGMVKAYNKVLEVLEHEK